jgi:uncharacterized protein (DUF1919 family)
LRREVNKQNREMLKNSDFSIISSNCVGGVILHELGLRFDSPTINLFMYPKDYIKFVYSLKKYISCTDMVEDQEETSKCGYPVGILDDIHIYFMHYPDFKIAKEKWYERCARIHWDNLYFIFAERDGCTLEEVKKFDALPFNKKVVFTAEPRPDIKCSFYINGSEDDHRQVRDLCQYRNRFTGIRWIDGFDYVSFLNN